MKFHSMINLTMADCSVALTPPFLYDLDTETLSLQKENKEIMKMATGVKEIKTLRIFISPSDISLWIVLIGSLPCLRRLEIEGAAFKNGDLARILLGSFTIKEIRLRRVFLDTYSIS